MAEANASRSLQPAPGLKTELRMFEKSLPFAATLHLPGWWEDS